MAEKKNDTAPMKTWDERTFQSYSFSPGKGTVEIKEEIQKLLLEEKRLSKSARVRLEAVVHNLEETAKRLELDKRSQSQNSHSTAEYYRIYGGG